MSKKSFIRKIIDNSLDTGGQVWDALGEATRRAGNDIADSASKTKLEFQIGVVDKEITACYTEIGKRYVEYMMSNDGDAPGYDVMHEPLEEILSKFLYKEKLEEEIAAIDRKSEQMASDASRLVISAPTTEQALADFQKSKELLDKLLLNGSLSRTDYYKQLSGIQQSLQNALLKQIES